MRRNSYVNEGPYLWVLRAKRPWDSLDRVYSLQAKAFGDYQTLKEEGWEVEVFHAVNFLTRGKEDKDE